jgi:hypothetical protein
MRISSGSELRAPRYSRPATLKEMPSLASLQRARARKAK